MANVGTMSTSSSTPTSTSTPTPTPTSYPSYINMAVGTMSTSSSSWTSTSTTSTSTSTTSTLCPSFLLTMIIFLSFLNIVLSKPSDAEMLLDLKSDLKNTGALDLTWKKGTDPCDEKNNWQGVGCRNGEIRSIQVPGLNLSGLFQPDVIVDLKGLRTIDIARNRFSGKIPDFYLIESLSNIDASDNKFNGDISSTYFSVREPTRWRILNFSSNELSGKIPDSLATVPNLKELYLQHNGFTGRVPLFKQAGMEKLNLGFNKLEGEIPEEMVTKFGPDAFAENPGLCSDKIGKACDTHAPSNGAGSSIPESSGMKWIILGVIVVVLLGTLVIRKRSSPDHFTPLAREVVDHRRVHVHKLKAMSRSRTSSINRRAGQPIGSHSPHSPVVAARKSPKGGKGNSDLIIVNDERGSFGLNDLMKAAAEVLGNGALGSAYKALMGNGVHVVVKRFRELNKMHRDEFDMAMRHLGGLRHKNILPLLAYNYRRDEKLIINEYVPRGSLMFLLHGDKRSAHSDLTWPIRLKIMKGVAQGMTFLHTEFSTYELPHGNLKSSNILLSASNEPLLTDYAFHPMFSTTQAAQSLFAYRSPEGVQYQEVSPKSDVFCLGIIILEILSGKFPSQYSNKKGGTDIIQWARSVVADRRETEMLNPEIASEEKRSVLEMVKLLHIGLDCTADEHNKRIHMKEATNRIHDINV